MHRTSHPVLRSAFGLSSFVGLLSLDGILQAANQISPGGQNWNADDALVRRNQLITVELGWVPVVRAGAVNGVICSAVDLTARP